MKPNSRCKALGVCSLLVVFVVVGCERIALRPRPALEELDRRTGAERREADRAATERADPPRQRTAANEITGTVQKIDHERREIHLRSTEAKMMVIKYDPATMVYDRDREIRIDSLRYGDLILVRVIKNSLGEQYADLIRIAS